MFGRTAVRQRSIKNDLQRLLQNAATKSPGVRLSSVDRETLREISASTDFVAREPEKLLLEFHAFLIEAADDAAIPPGPERNELLVQLMSVYIEELAVSRFRSH